MRFPIRSLITFALVFAFANSGLAVDLGTLITTENALFPIICLDSSGHSRIDVDSFHVEVVRHDGSESGGNLVLSYSASGDTTAAWVTRSLPNGDTTWWFRDAIADIDGDAGNGQYTGVVKAYKFGKETVNPFSFYLTTTSFSTLIERLDAAVTTRLAPTTAGRTLDVTAAGEAGLDFDNAVGTINGTEFAAETDIVSGGAITTSGGAVSTVTNVTNSLGTSISAAEIDDNAIDSAAFAADAKKMIAIRSDSGVVDVTGLGLSTLTSSDNIGINWADVSNPTSTVGLTNTTVGTTTNLTNNNPNLDGATGTLSDAQIDLLTVTLPSDSLALILTQLAALLTDTSQSLSANDSALVSRIMRRGWGIQLGAAGSTDSTTLTQRTVNVDAVDGNTTSAAKLKEMNRFLRKGVCAGTHTTTNEEILLDDSPIDDDDNNFYSGMQIMWLTGTNAGAVRRITQSSANSAGDHNLTVQPPLGQASIDGDSILILHNAELIFSQNGTFPSLLINARMTSAIDGAIDSADIDANVYTYLAGLAADSTWRKGWAFATGTAATVGQGLDAIRDSTDEMAATSASSLDSVTVWRLLRRMFGLDVASGDTLTVAQRTVTDVSGVGGGSCGSGSQTVTLCVQDTSGTDEFVAQAHVSIYTDAARTSLYADPFTQTGGCQTLNLDASTTYYYSITRAGFTFDTNNFTTGSGGTWGDTLLGYNVVVGSPGSASLCRVYGYLSDGPNAIRHADVTLTLENVASGQVVVDTVADRTVAIRTFTVKTDANGYWYIDVVPNTYLTPPNTTYHYTASKAGVTLPGQEKSGLTVPTDATARIEDLF